VGWPSWIVTFGALGAWLARRRGTFVVRRCSRARSPLGSGHQAYRQLFQPGLYGTRQPSVGPGDQQQPSLPGRVADRTTVSLRMCGTSLGILACPRMNGSPTSSWIRYRHLFHLVRHRPGLVRILPPGPPELGFSARSTSSPGRAVVGACISPSTESQQQPVRYDQTLDIPSRSTNDARTGRSMREAGRQWPTRRPLRSRRNVDGRILAAGRLG
jgi:hypothetical protein